MSVPPDQATGGHSKSGVTGSSASASSNADAASDHISPHPASDVELPFAPTTAITSPDNYGGLNPENENSLGLINGVSSASLRRHHRLPNSCGQVAVASQDVNRLVQSRENFSLPTPHQAPNMTTASPLLVMPPEIVDTILSYLNPYDLIRMSAVCRTLRSFALSDNLWQALVQQRVPGVRVTRPYPCANFQELFSVHDPVWFLPKYKLWFCDRDMTGKLIVARYDPRRGCIEGLQVLASNIGTEYSPWEADEGVIIHNFKPSIRLHLERPVFEFKAGYANDPGSLFSRLWARRFTDEVPIDLDERRQGMYSNFMFTKPLDIETEEMRYEEEYPYGDIWPPPMVPAHHRVGGHRFSDDMLYIETADRPVKMSQASNQTFRIRRWMEMLGARASVASRSMPGGGDGTENMFGAGPTGVHIGEEILTFSTLDPSLYTPTPTKPWRGIWIGDYSGHGCEFLLINQPDDEPATDEELGLFRDSSETGAEWEQRRLEARIYRGRLEAIKLTGDPNVPRGEYTFVVPDMGKDGYAGEATDARFKGARKVKSQGHVATTGFMQNKFINSQLLLLSHNRLAQHWTEFGHVSFFERVDLDALLDPSQVQL